MKTCGTCGTAERAMCAGDYPSLQTERTTNHKERVFQ